jgi:UDPglucose 6-dehydrogenase
MSFTFLNIIGYGYVGGGLGHLCKSNNVPFCTFDVIQKDEPMAKMNTDNLEKLVEHSELYNEDNVYTICVPTPSSTTGECDISIVESVIEKLYKTVKSKSNIVIIKSTVQPGTTRMLMNKFQDKLEIVFCPEFLKEHTYKEDMYNADFCLVGSDNIDTKVSDVMRKLYKHKEIDVICRSSEECEIFKYTVNVFLAVKVWYFNEISEICNKFGVEYKGLQSLFKLEPRIGESHTDVPGHDKLHGFGGKCLPKETLALKYLQENLGIPNQVLENIISRNNKLRYNKD